MSEFVPEGWNKKIFSDAVTLTYGKSPKYIFSEGGIYPVVGTGGITGYTNNYLHEGNTVVIGRKGTINKPSFIYNKFWAIDTTYYVSAYKKLDAKWFFYLLQNTDLTKYNEASGVPSLNRDTLYSIPFITPPLPEQQKIAAILTSVDEVIEKTQAQINKLKDLKTGMMQELLTRGVGVDGNPHTEFKDSPVGSIPKAWDCVRLEFLLKSSKNSMRSGPFGSALLKHELVPSGHPYLGIDNVHIERFENKFKRFVSDEKFEQLQRYAVQEDDVMITIMGTVGRSCVVPKGVGKALSSKHVWTMSFDQQKYIPALICWQLNYSDWIKLQFKNESQGGVMESISSKTLKELWLPLPPISEQNKINKVHKSLSESIRVKEGLLYKYKQLKKALMQDLLTGKVRVKVDS